MLHTQPIWFLAFLVVVLQNIYNWLGLYGKLLIDQSMKCICMKWANRTQSKCLSSTGATSRTKNILAVCCMTTWQSIIYVYNVQMSKGENGSPYIHALICVLILEAKPIWAKLAKKKTSPQVVFTALSFLMTTSPRRTRHVWFVIALQLFQLFRRDSYRSFIKYDTHGQCIYTSEQFHAAFLRVNKTLRIFSLRKKKNR